MAKQSPTMNNKVNTVGEFDSYFVKRVKKSRNSFLIWIPQNECEYLGITEDSLVKIGIKIVHPMEIKKK